MNNYDSVLDSVSKVSILDQIYQRAIESIKFRHYEEL